MTKFAIATVTRRLKTFCRLVLYARMSDAQTSSLTNLSKKQVEGGRSSLYDGQNESGDLVQARLPDAGQRSKGKAGVTFKQKPCPFGSPINSTLARDIYQFPPAFDLL